VIQNGQFDRTIDYNSCYFVLDNLFFVEPGINITTTTIMAENFVFRFMYTRYLINFLTLHHCYNSVKLGKPKQDYSLLSDERTIAFWRKHQTWKTIQQKFNCIYN